VLRERSEHIEALLNGSVLDGTYGFDSPVRDSDRITLVDPYAGGRKKLASILPEQGSAAIVITHLTSRGPRRP
jgi:hypothetical protein